jgi:hypothetical protein
MSKQRKIFLFLAVPLVVIFAVVTTTENTAYKAGKAISQGCEGEGFPYKLSKLPMDESDFSVVIPYGLMVGGHVTPIDHQYFAPADYMSKRDVYEVYAMADATITEIGERTNDRGTEYRLVFAITCNYFYYYDLVTSLTSEIKKVYDDANSGQFKKAINIKVKAGELIGRIGGQTLDFAVWDTTKPLKGFIFPEHYKAENWKLYTADPLDYYTNELKTKVLARSPRTAEPVSGKIDYDVDGKLIGNWFEEGTNWYGGKTNGNGGEYWGGHLSFAPDHYDPTYFIISIGDFEGQPKQFTTIANTPDPASVSVDTGLVKFELVQWGYTDAEGTPWFGNSVIEGPKAKPQTSVQGCALVQMKDTKSIQFESFPKQSCSAVAGFTGKVKTYTR